MASWFERVPDMTKRASSFPARAADESRNGSKKET